MNKRDICSEDLLEESLEKSGGTGRVRLKLSAFPKVRLVRIQTDENGVGASSQQRSSQKIDQRPLFKMSSPLNPDGEALKDAAGGSSDENPLPAETLAVVVKEEEETVSEDSGDEYIPEDIPKSIPKNIPKASHKDPNRPKASSSKYYRYRSVKQLCDDCGCFYNPKKPHTCEYKIKPYVCNMCGKRCRTKISLKSHNHMHDNTRIYPCKYCYAPCRSQQDKITHQDTHKDEPNPFKCHSCSATFNCFLLRKKHLGTHERAKQHTCEKCGTAFTKKHVLDRHMLIHSGEKAFKCPICSRGFNQPGNMKSHMRLHTGEKPYKCLHCNQAFNHNVSLKSHMQRYHSDIWLPKLEDVYDVDDQASGSHSAGDVEQLQSEALNSNKYSTGRPKGRPKRNEMSSPKGKRKADKSLLGRYQSDEQTEEVSHGDWSSDLSEEIEKWCNSDSKISTD